MNRLADIAIVVRAGERGYIVQARRRRGVKGARETVAPALTWTQEYGPFLTLWSARRRARQLDQEYRDLDTLDVVIDEVSTPTPEGRNTP